MIASCPRPTRRTIPLFAYCNHSAVNQYPLAFRSVSSSASCGRHPSRLRVRALETGLSVPSPWHLSPHRFQAIVAGDGDGGSAGSLAARDHEYPLRHHLGVSGLPNLSRNFSCVIPAFAAYIFDAWSPISVPTTICLGISATNRMPSLRWSEMP